MIPNNSEEIAQLLYNKLVDDRWKLILRSFIKYSDFYKIIDTLKDKVDDGKRFVPPIRSFFNPFISCNYDSLKIVFLTDEPYNSIESADGLAFSCPNSMFVPDELSAVQKEISKTVYKNAVKKFNTELKGWAMQGILLLNSALTAEIGKKGRHYDLWRPFISYVVDMLSAKKEDMIFVLFGENAKKYQKLINKNKHTIFVLDMPNGDESWDSQDIFNKLNTLLSERNQDTVVW